MTEDQVKQLRNSALVLSLEESRKSNFLCDFTVKVGEKSFHTHRIILANSSGYFRSLFETQMKESQEGFIDMKGVDAAAIELCISFMYTGKADISMATVENILHASNLLQLDDLKNLCAEKMRNNLTSQNCLFVIHLAGLYNLIELMKDAEDIISFNFDSVVSSAMFTSITKSELLRYVEISRANHRTWWNAVVKWSKGQSNTLTNFEELTKHMDVRIFSFKFLLETVLKEPLVTKSGIEKDVIKILFDVRKLKENIEVENCFFLKEQAEKHEISNSADVKDLIHKFLQQNFEEIVKLDGFCEISKTEVEELLKSAKNSSETSKYEAMIKWVKFDVKQRKKTFSELFCLIKLQNLPDKYLKEIVRKETLVTDSRKCNGMLLDEIFSRLDKGPSQARAAENTTDRGFINVQPEGKMTRKIISSFLPGFKERTNEILYKFDKGVIQEVRYPAEQFVAYLPNTHEGWNLLDLLFKAFDAQMIFKIEVTGKVTGEIVWGDIPHKTCKTGGPPNGYPDFNYLDRLKKALELKGIH